MIETPAAPRGYGRLTRDVPWDSRRHLELRRLEETAAAFDGPPEGRLISFGTGT